MDFRDLISHDRPPKTSAHFGDAAGRSLLSREEIDMLFGDAGAFPVVDVTEDDDGFRISARLHGMEAEHIDVTAGDGVVTIEGERREEKNIEDDDRQHLRREISYGSFCRVVSLPDSADLGAAKASFNDGMLTVDVPKKPGAARKSTKIPVTEN